MTEVACEQTDEEQIGQLPMHGSSQLKMVQHCSANAEAMGSNSDEVPFFFLVLFAIG